MDPVTAWAGRVEILPDFASFWILNEIMLPAPEHETNIAQTCNEGAGLVPQIDPSVKLYNQGEGPY